MKTSDIVKVNISNIPPVFDASVDNNPTGAVIIVADSATTGVGESNDTNWLTYADIELTSPAAIKTEVDKIYNTFRVNGGINLVFKRIYIADAADLNDAFITAAKTLDKSIICIQLAVAGSISETPLSLNSTGIKFIADGLISTDNPEEAKIIFVTSSAVATGLTATPNVFYHYIGAGTNHYESVAAMAYLTRIDYQNSIIKDYEYTEWYGANNDVSLVTDLPVQTGGYVNIFTRLANRNILINGVMTNNVRLITYYFTIVLTQKITDVLIEMILNKINFDDASYVAMYNAVSLLLDIFANNGLLDLSYVVTEEAEAFRDGTRYLLLEANEQLIEGYKILTLPPDQNDLSTRIYTGLIIYIAINNQIRKIEVSGLVVGGV